MTRSLAITSIGGNYVRDPQVLLTPSFSEQQALNAAAGTIADWIYEQTTLVGANSPNFPFLNNPLERLKTFQQNQIFYHVLSQAQSKGLVVFPAVLNQRASARNDLAYWFEFPEAKVLVSATNGQTISAIPNRSFTDRTIFGAEKTGELSFANHVPLIHNGTPIPGATLNPDAIAADSFVLNTLSFYTGLGRTSYDNNNSDVRIITDSVFTLSKCPNAFWDGFRNEAWFCLGMVTDDILAHEFTHGVTASTARLFPIDESGALNEHYSDVMAAMATQNTPGGPWVLGEGSVRAGSPSAAAPSNIRLMSNPALSCRAQPTNYANYIPRPATCLGLLGRGAWLGREPSRTALVRHNSCKPGVVGLHAGWSRPALDFWLVQYRRWSYRWTRHFDVLSRRELASRLHSSRRRTPHSSAGRQPALLGRSVASPMRGTRTSGLYTGRVSNVPGYGWCLSYLWRDDCHSVYRDRNRNHNRHLFPQLFSVLRR
jgi:hypothetical protein